MFLPFVIGIVASAGVALFARNVRLDRDRAFYPTLMIVIALYYVLFAVMTGSMQTVLAESVVMLVFAAAAVAGFQVERVDRRCRVSRPRGLRCLSWLCDREPGGTGVVASPVFRV
jgi:hypothetical protein